MIHVTIILCGPVFALAQVQRIARGGGAVWPKNSLFSLRSGAHFTATGPRLEPDGFDVFSATHPIVSETFFTRSVLLAVLDTSCRKWSQTRVRGLGNFFFDNFRVSVRTNPFSHES